MKLNKRLSVAALVVFFLSALIGCGKDGSDTRQVITITPIDFKAWEKQLESYQPEIVVVDLWAMWCTSCIKRFPHMVTMSERYREQGVRFVSMNLDDRNDLDAVADAKLFVKKLDARFDHFHMDENLIDAFEYFQLIGIPAVLVFDGHGVERFRLTGDNPNAQFTEEDIEQAVNDLLNKAHNTH